MSITTTPLGTPQAIPISAFGHVRHHRSIVERSRVAA
jgi:hypothetical protein